MSAACRYQEHWIDYDGDEIDYSEVCILTVHTSFL